MRQHLLIDQLPSPLATDDPVPAQTLNGSQRLGFRCVACGEIIGTWEPAVALVDDRPLWISRAGDPQAFAAARARYHRDCFGGGPRPASDGVGG